MQADSIHEQRAVEQICSTIPNVACARERLSGQRHHLSQRGALSDQLHESVGEVPRETGKLGKTRISSRGRIFFWNRLLLVTILGWLVGAVMMYAQIFSLLFRQGCEFYSELG